MSRVASRSQERIVLSYRRDDVPHAVDRIADRLRERFGSQTVFVDIASIKPSEDWRETIERTLKGCDALLVIIGPGWLKKKRPDGRAALDDPEDPVRREIEAGLERRIVLIPVLLDGAEVPPADQLPRELQRLLSYHAFSVRRDHFDFDVSNLLELIDSEVQLTASFGRRATAFAIDALLPIGVAMLADPSYGPPEWIFAGVFIPYHWLLTAVTGRTLGKLLVGVRVEFAEASLARWVNALFRPTIGYACSVLSIVGLVQFLLHRRHSTFHDVLFGTRVLRGRKAPRSVPRSLDRLSQAVDDWIQKLLGSLGPLGRLVSYLVTAHFGVVLLVNGITAAPGWVMRRLGYKATSQAGASAGVVGTTVPPLITGLILAGGSVVALDSLAPEALRPAKHWTGARIYAVEYPRTLKMDGPQQDIKVFWSGSLKFPVRVVLRPRKEEPQPSGAYENNVAIDDETNPLIVPKVLCAEDYPGKTEFRFEVLLRDADGNETGPIETDFTAIPDKDAPARIPRSQRTGGVGIYRPEPCQYYRGDE